MGKHLDAIRAKSKNAPVRSVLKVSKIPSDGLLALSAPSDSGYLEKREALQEDSAQNQTQDVELAKVVESPEKQADQPLVDSFDKVDEDFYSKALECHQRGWDRLYYRGKTYPIKQEFGQLSRKGKSNE